jgi:hypothetical protein
MSLSPGKKVSFTSRVPVSPHLDFKDFSKLHLDLRPRNLNAGLPPFQVISQIRLPTNCAFITFPTITFHHFLPTAFFHNPSTTSSSRLLPPFHPVAFFRHFNLHLTPWVLNPSIVYSQRLLRCQLVPARTSANWPARLKRLRLPATRYATVLLKLASRPLTNLNCSLQAAGLGPSPPRNDPEISTVNPVHLTSSTSFLVLDNTCQRRFDRVKCAIRGLIPCCRLACALVAVGRLRGMVHHSWWASV